MGSMSKVMKKVLEDQEHEQQAPTVEPTSPDRPAGDASSGFVADESAAAAPARDESSSASAPHTVAWNAARVDPVVIAFHERYSAICEQYRSIRARLLSMSAGAVQQVIAITSSIPEEGKSVSSINLGIVMAEGGEHKICVADADFRRSSIARMLGIPEKPGLAEVLRGEARLEEVAQPTPFPNLKVLPAGEVRNSAYAELLGGPNTAAVLDELRVEFDYTFLDTPPITTVSDVSMLAPHCNGTLVVIEMHRTPEPTVQQAVRTLQANNVKVMGCILSRFRERGSRYYDHYYSYYYQR